MTSITTGPGDSEPIVTFTVRELIERIDDRVERLERSAARQATVRLAVALSLLSGPGASVLTFFLTRR